MKKDEDFKYCEMSQKNKAVENNDIRIVDNLPVKCVFHWSDKIVADFDEETGHTEYTSGFVMRVLPDQTFVYKGEKSILVAMAAYRND